MIDNKTKKYLASNIKGLFLDMSEWMDERNHELRKSKGMLKGTPAETKLFATLRGRERSISELARVMGLSRQAVHHTVQRLKAVGVIEVVESPKSKREKIVKITEKGHEIQKSSAKNIRQIERELAKTIGKDNVELIRDLLTQHLARVKTDHDG